MSVVEMHVTGNKAPEGRHVTWFHPITCRPSGPGTKKMDAIATDRFAPPGLFTHDALAARGKKG